MVDEPPADPRTRFDANERNGLPVRNRAARRMELCLCAFADEIGESGGGYTDGKPSHEYAGDGGDDENPQVNEPLNDNS
jgi:hypothetical protein